MLWELLAAKRFWGELSDAEIFLKLETGDFASPRSLDPGVPRRSTRSACERSAKDPDARFASAGEMQIALEDWLASTGERAGPRQLTALLGELFAERRAAVREEIEAQMARAAGSPPTLVDVPIARAFNEPSHPTGAGQYRRGTGRARGARQELGGFAAHSEERTSAATRSDATKAHREGPATSGGIASTRGTRTAVR